MKELKGIRKDVVWVDEPAPLSEKALEAFHKTVTEYPWQKPLLYGEFPKTVPYGSGRHHGKGVLKDTRNPIT